MKSYTSPRPRHHFYNLALASGTTAPWHRASEYSAMSRLIYIHLNLISRAQIAQTQNTPLVTHLRAWFPDEQIPRYEARSTLVVLFPAALV